MDHPTLMQQLQERAIPPLYSGKGSQDGIEAGHSQREHWVGALAAGEYGRMPPKPVGVEVREIKRVNNAFGSKAIHIWYQLSCATPGGRFSFPFQLVMPEGTVPVPVFVQPSFFGELPNPSCPVSDLMDRGFGIASFQYGDVVPDRADALDEGLAGRFGAASRGADGTGAIGYWAWAAQRIVDFLLVHPRVDPAWLAVIGHSRLGKTALWAGATDDRFSLTVSIQSGCSGAAITRGKAGERVANISRSFPHWFCPDYAQYADREADMPFEQHQLLASLAPRLLYVSSAQEDTWADPASEFLGCVAASLAWDVHGVPGFITPDSLPECGKALQEGRVGYHLREGGHALEPTDWRHVMDFWALHKRVL